MRWILYTLGALLGAGLLMAAIGATLPQDHVATCSAVIHQPPEVVFDAIADLTAATAWNSAWSRVEPLEPDGAGKPRFRVHSGGDAVVYRIEDSVRPTRLVTRIEGDDLPYGGAWIYELRPDDGGTRITITERGEVYNPLFRLLARFVFGHHGTLEAYLTALGSKFGEQVAPQSS